MRKYLLIFILFGIPHISNAEMTEPDPSVIDEDMKEYHADLLRSNFKDTDFTGHVKINAVSVYGEDPPYVVLAFQVEVLEVFKGERRRELTYRYAMEGTSNTFDLKQWEGHSLIVSLYQADDDPDLFAMVDNGYDLPDTPDLLSIARGLAEMANPAFKRDAEKRGAP